MGNFTSGGSIFTSGDGNLRSEERIFRLRGKNLTWDGRILRGIDNV